MKMKRVFVPHHQYRFDTLPLLDIAEEIVYVCNSPMFDDISGQEFAPKFEGSIAKVMGNFDPKQDGIAYYGDAVVFAMMVAYLFTYVLEEGDKLKVARFSKKLDAYVIRELCEENFELEGESTPQS